MSSAGPGRREVAHRLFAAEYDDATLEYAESDEERAPNYVVTPSGARVNRLFVVGVLTTVEQVNEDTIRARIADPTGAFVVYAGQYQPDELAALQSMDSPAFVAVTGKANTFSPEGSDRVLTSVRPESVTEVDAETRDRWVVATAEHTLARVQTAASALEREERGEDLRAALLREGVEPGFAEGIAKALDHYDTTADYLDALADLASQALEVVAGERSEVEALETAPDESDGAVSAGDLAELLGEDRRSATQAAEDVDPEVLLESDASDAGEAAAETEGDAEDAAASTTEADADGAVGEEADEETRGEIDEEADGEVEADTDQSGAEEPVTDERAVEATAADAEEAADAGTEEPGEESAGAEPETSESAVEETAADAEAAADTDASEEATSEEAEQQEPAEGDAADEMYEVDEDEREEIEEEYGVEFQSGTEVDPAGEAGIETEDEPPAADESDGEGTEESEPASPEGESADEVAAEAGDVDEEDTDEAETDDGAGEEDTGADDGGDASEEGDESAEDVDLESVLLEGMDDLDEGEGADRDALQSAVAEETGADADAIDDAIDDLLMSGQCYEPSEGTLKPI